MPVRFPTNSRGLVAIALLALAAAAPLGKAQAASDPGASVAGAIDPATGLRRLPYAINPTPARYATSGPIIIRHVRIIDGKGNKPQLDQDLVIENGRITAIGRGGALTAPAGATEVDGRGQTLLPGLMDLHSHFRGVDRMAAMVVEDPALLSDVYRYKSQLYSYLYSGVTTVLDVGTQMRVSVGLKRLIDDDYVLGPRYFWSGPIIEGGNDMSSFENVAVPSAKDAPATIDYLHGLNVDFVKVYQGTSDKIAKALADKAHAAGLRVMIDAWERNDLAQYIAYDGIDGYAHLNFHFRISEHDAKVLAERDAFVFTTFYALNAFSGRIYSERPGYFDDPLIADVMPPEYVAAFKRNPTDPLAKTANGIQQHVIDPFAHQMEVPQGGSRREVFDKMSKIGGDNLRALLDAGVLVAAGTDGGQGESLLTELELAVTDAGILPLTAIQLATWNAARVLKQDKDLGSVEQGKIADLVLVEGDPSKDIRALRNIRSVIKNGKIVDRASLTRQWSY